MDSAYLIILFAFASSAVYAFLIGSIWQAVLISSLGAGVFATGGGFALSPWFFGIFLMAAVPYAGVALAGGAVGLAIRRRFAPRPVVRMLGVVAIFATVIAFMVALGFSVYDDARWNSIIAGDAIFFVSRNEDVLNKVGQVKGVSVSSIGHGRSFSVPYTSVTYFIRGEQRDVRATVSLAGSADQPIFALESVEPLGRHRGDEH